VVVMMVAYVVTMLVLPAPRPTIALAITSGQLDTGQANTLAWPSSGGAAIGAVGAGVLAANNADQPMPTASVAKVILAIAILQRKPLEPDQTGPTITFTDKDVAIYQTALAQNGSVVPVSVGEHMTEYQALQALLLPSGNNIASSLADWEFGSEQQYIAYATTMLHGMGLTKTHLEDASGYSPYTISTPRELVLIGEQALQYPVLATIVAQKQATLPVAGQISNVNADLGQRDINGIKTGNTQEAGGCLLFSATRHVGDAQVTLVGAVQSLPNLQEALTAAPDLVDNAYLHFVYAAGLPAHVGTMTVPWASAVHIVPKKDVSQVVWNGATLTRDISVQPGVSGVVGKAKVGNQTTDLTLESAIPAPSPWWRLTHPWQLVKALRG
jgi:D-alanyl-D-alanine carboxypeptidase (penicillin-binding protein 5/6)